jgi:hypothetical protein
LALERSGKIPEARELMLRAWGDRSESYEVTVRLAWLCLREGEAEQAIRFYQRARSLAGAGPEATEGLVSAWLLLGDQRLERGDVPGARAAWRRALEVDPRSEAARRALATIPSRRIDPELWGAYLTERVGAFRAAGWAVFAHVPVKLSDDWRMRAAYRHDELRVPNGSLLRFADGSARYRQDDAYLGVGYGGGVWGLDLLGLALFSSTESTVFGEAATVRLGRRYGVLLEQAVLGRGRGTNLQLGPLGFVWPSPHLGFGAGIRVTWDDAGQAASGQAGVTLALPSLRVDLSGHLGTERWPVTPAVPIVLTLAQDLTLGGTLTTVIPLGPAWAFGVQGQAERLEAEGYRGWYLSAALGLVWSPRIDD